MTEVAPLSGSMRTSRTVSERDAAFLPSAKRRSEPSTMIVLAPPASISSRTPSLTLIWGLDEMRSASLSSSSRSALAVVAVESSTITTAANANRFNMPRDADGVEPGGGRALTKRLEPLQLQTMDASRASPSPFQLSPAAPGAGG